MVELYIVGGIAAVLAAVAARSAIKVVWRRVFRAKARGRAGESKVNRILKRTSRNGARAKNDILLNTSRGTSQIDHVLITKQGILAIETKNYSGIVQGTEEGRIWTQRHPGSYTEPRQFYNPIWQNKGHISALRSVLPDYKDVPFHSLVVFSDQCSFPQLPGVVSVGSLTSAIKMICSGPAVLSDRQIQEISNILEQNMITSRSGRAEHNYRAGLNASSDPGEVKNFIKHSIQNAVDISAKPATEAPAMTSTQRMRQMLTDSHAKLTIHGKTDTIEGFFEAAKRRSDGQPVVAGGNFDYFVCPYTSAQFPASEAISFYEGLWIAYLKNKPELVDFMKTAGTETLGNSFRCRKVLAQYSADKDGFIKQVRSSAWYQNMAVQSRRKDSIDSRIQTAAVSAQKTAHRPVVHGKESQPEH